MNVFKRMALGSILFGLIGPQLVGFGLATLFSIAAAINEPSELGKNVLLWMYIAGFANSMAYYGGILPATFVGSFVGFISTRISPPLFYVLSIALAIVTCIVYFGVISDTGFGLVIGTASSIPATAILGKCLLWVVRRPQIGHV